MNLLPFSPERTMRSVEKVRERLLRATAALERSSIPYAVIGGNAVAAWVSRVDESAVRFTQDVDLLVDRSDFEKVQNVLEGAGFQYRHAAGVELFLDGPNAKARDAVHVVFAGEYVREGEPAANPSVSDSEHTGEYRIASLRAVVQIKLTAFRDKDRTHLRDLISVGLLDASWLPTLPDELARRLKAILDVPNG